MLFQDGDRGKQPMRENSRKKERLVGVERRKCPITRVSIAIVFLFVHTSGTCINWAKIIIRKC